MTDWDGYWLEVARSVALGSDCVRRQVGCVITTQSHRVVSSAFNSTWTGETGCADGRCPRSVSRVPVRAGYEGDGSCVAVHAEQKAVAWAGRLAWGAVAYVTCRPCSGCAAVLRGAGVQRVVTPKYRDVWREAR